MVQNILTVADFDSILDSYAGRKIIHIPVTQSTSNISGQETLTEGTPVVLKMYLMRTGQNWDFSKAGFLEKGDAIALTKYADSVGMNDVLLDEGTYLTISSIDGDATTITVTTSSVHGLSAGDSVVIAGTTNYNNTFVVGTITSTLIFTIASTDYDLASEATGTLLRSYRKFRVKETWDVPGVFDSTGNTTAYSYTSNNLFYSQ